MHDQVYLGYFLDVVTYLNISRSRSGSLALLDFPFSLVDLEGLLLGVCKLDLEVTGVVDRTREGVKGSAGRELELLRLVLEMLREHEFRGTGTLRLEDRDCLPFWMRLIPGDLGSGVRDMETPEMNSVGDLGIPVSLSYSLELSVSRGWPLLHLVGLLQIFILKLEEKPEDDITLDNIFD